MVVWTWVSGIYFRRKKRSNLSLHKQMIEYLKFKVKLISWKMYIQYHESGTEYTEYIPNK